MAELRFVNDDGKVLFTEADNGKLTFQDQQALKEFQEAVAQLGVTPSPSPTSAQASDAADMKAKLTRAEDLLHKLWANPTPEWTKEKITARHAQVTKAMAGLGLQATQLK